MPLAVMAKHLGQHLELVHLRQTMLDHDPVLGQVGVERLLLTGQRLPPTRLVRQMARTQRPVLVRL